MKVTIIVVVLFVAAKQVTSEKEGKANVSNETVASLNETEPTSIFNNIVPMRKKNDPALKRENSTSISSIEDFTIHNATQDHFANTTGANSTTGTVKLDEVSSNITSENASIANITDYESKNKPKENSTVDDSAVHKTTREYLINYSTIQESLTNVTSTSRSNLYTTRGISNSNTIDESTKIEPDDNSISSDKDVTIAQERHTRPRTEVNSEIPILDPQQHQNYCESYIDKLLTAAFTEHADQLDPLILEDRRIVFENTFIFSSLKGEVGLYDGKVTGLSKSISFGECKVQIRDDQVKLEVLILFDEAEISYKGRSTFMEFGPKITVNGKLSGTLVELQIVLPKDGGIGEIKSVRVRNIGRMEVDVRGLGPLNRALELISENMISDFRSNFRRSIERELKKALEDEIKKISYP